ncbi:MarR family transcriptional regulator [Streptomyces polygonati]|uniref:MarR family transcriptional regulator n=1 Tax=Streptomyces polygonati TaxID=1617087 RepID=A0ABV8HYG8_9ACTN
MTSPSSTESAGSPGSAAAAAPLNPRILGQAENAHTAILNRALAGTELNKDHWVALSLTMAAGSALAVDELVGQVTAALKVDQAGARAVIADLVATELLDGKEIDGEVAVTESGRLLFGQIRGATGRIVARAYSAVPAEDLQVAGRVLATITSRLNEELAAA